jgi:hypothetical protein
MTEELDESTTSSSPARPAAPRTISRRAVGLGAVWTVPVILTATAAPAAAASVAPAPPVGPVLGTPGLTANKVAAAKRIDFTLRLSNTGTAQGQVDVLSLTSTGGGTPQGVPTSVMVPAGHSVDVDVSWDYGGNNGTADYTITYRMSGTTGTVGIRA